jgi:hypothetical protein
MALVGLIRVTQVARLLGVCTETVVRWLAASGLPTARAPVVGWPRTGTGRNSPVYVSLDSALTLVDRLLPSVVDRRVRDRARLQLRRHEQAIRKSTANIKHDLAGGTGSGIPTPKPALQLLGEFPHTQIR